MKIVPTSFRKVIRFCLALLSSVSALSQTTDWTAAKLIQNLAESASQERGWKIEGYVSYFDKSLGHTTTASLTMTARSSKEVRFEQSGDFTPATIVCDGSRGWLYSPPLHQYKLEANLTPRLCAPIISEWANLPTKLKSAKFGKGCAKDPDAPSQMFRLIEGVSEPELSSGSQISRTLCMDPDRSVVLWERWENRSAVLTKVYSKVERGSETISNTFTFVPPTDARQTELDLPLPRTMGSRGLSGSPNTIFPKVTVKRDPKYGEASRKARTEGSVIVYCVVDRNGVGKDFAIYQSLSPDLDLEAIKAVRQWRFVAGTVNGVAADIAVEIELNFRMQR